jgi:hypothetical protein
VGDGKMSCDILPEPPPPPCCFSIPSPPGRESLLSATNATNLSECDRAAVALGWRTPFAAMAWPVSERRGHREARQLAVCLNQPSHLPFALPMAKTTPARIPSWCTIVPTTHGQKTAGRGYRALGGRATEPACPPRQRRRRPKAHEGRPYDCEGRRHLPRRAFWASFLPCNGLLSIHRATESSLGAPTSRNPSLSAWAEGPRSPFERSQALNSKGQPAWRENPPSGTSTTSPQRASDRRPYRRSLPCR